MPMKEGYVYCINHPDEAMIRNEGFNALTTVTRENSHVQFNSATGVPTVTYFCNKCGYIEIYAAQKTPYWEQAVINDMKSQLGEE